MSNNIQPLLAERDKLTKRAVEISELPADQLTADLQSEFEAIMGSTESDLAGRLDELDGQIKEMQKRSEAAKARLAKYVSTPDRPNNQLVIPSIGDGGGAADLHAAIENDPLCGFKDRLDFLTAVVVDGRRQDYIDDLQTERDPRMAFLASGCTSCTSTTSSDHKVPMPTPIASELMSLRSEPDDSCWKPLQTPLSSPSLSIPAICDKNGGLDSYAGVHAYWLSEDHCMKNYENLDYEMITLNAHDMIAGACFTLNMIKDSPRTVAALIDQALPRAVRQKLRASRLLGTGQGQFLGVYNSPGFITTAGRETAGTITFSDIVDLSILHGDLSGAGLFIHPTSLPCFFDMWLDGKSCCNIAFNPNPNDGCQYGTFVPLGLPIVVSELAPCKGECNDVSIINFRYFAEGTYERLSERFSDHFLFNCRKRVWQLHTRVAGMPLLSGPLTPDRPCTGYTEISPLGVGLGAATCPAEVAMPKPEKK